MNKVPVKKISARRVVVVGSLNIDLIARVQRLPLAGETVPASGLLRRFGGKGANQAVAAARQGAAVSLIGCVGDDADGTDYCAQLSSREGINTRAITHIRGKPTGTALIAVEERGQNCIVVAAGANAKLSAAAVRARVNDIRRAHGLLVQLEVPLSAVLAAMRLAHAAAVPVVFNPSPLRADFPWGRVALDTVIVNELEARQIFGRPVTGLATALSEWRAVLKQHRVSQLIITRGAQATLCLTAGSFFRVPTLRVRPVDTVGAGDTFAGVLAARLAEGCSLLEAVTLANVAGGLATLKPGAQAAIPTRAETERQRSNLHPLV